MEGRLFSGKRDARRVERSLPVAVKGRDGTFHGNVVDISESGVLLRVSGPGLEPADPLVPYADQVRARLGDVVALTIGERIVRQASLVRVTSWGAGAEGAHLIAYRFARRLTAKECAALGIEPGADEDAEV